MQTLRVSLDDLASNAGQLHSWARGGDPTAPTILGGRTLVFGGVAALCLGLAWFFGVSRRLDARVISRPPTSQPLGSPLPDELQGSAQAAVRQGFLATLQALEASGRVDEVATLTNGQVARRLQGSLWERYNLARVAFEATWYGGQSAGEAEILVVEEALVAARGQER